MNAGTYLTTRQAAEYTGHCEDHIRNMASLYQATKNLKRRQGLKGHQRVPSGPWKFTRADLDSFMQG